MEFATWISPEIKLYIIKDYQRLKTDEGHRLSIEWSFKRELAKANYRFHTDAIKEYLLADNLSPSQINYTYTNEADILNVALFGMTAKDWRNQNPNTSGNIRDYASIQQLIVLTNLESMNSEMIKQKLVQKDRLKRLNKMATDQLKALSNSPAAQRLTNDLTPKSSLLQSPES